MTRKLRALASLLAVALLFSGSSFAHHAWVGYDMSNITSLQGTVTKFDWENPHVWMEFDVPGANGGIANWSGGGPSPNRMERTGWDKNTVKPGDRITVYGNRITDGTNKMRLVKVVLPDGRELMCYGRPGGG